MDSCYTSEDAAREADEAAHGAYDAEHDPHYPRQSDERRAELLAACAARPSGCRVCGDAEGRPCLNLPSRPPAREATDLPF